MLYILLATLFRILTVNPLLLTHIRIPDAAVDGLGKETIERFSELGRCWVLFSRHIPVVATLVLQDKMTVHNLSEWYNADNFIRELSFVHELVAGQATHSTHVTPHECEYSLVQNAIAVPVLKYEAIVSAQ